MEISVQIYYEMEQFKFEFKEEFVEPVEEVVDEIEAGRRWGGTSESSFWDSDGGTDENAALDTDEGGGAEIDKIVESVAKEKWPT